jgi:hypothetical protein
VAPLLDCHRNAALVALGGAVEGWHFRRVGEGAQQASISGVPLAARRQLPLARTSVCTTGSNAL